jgi:hypothetical protein
MQLVEKEHQNNETPDIRMISQSPLRPLAHSLSQLTLLIPLDI